MKCNAKNALGQQIAHSNGNHLPGEQRENKQGRIEFRFATEMQASQNGCDDPKTLQMRWIGTIP